MGPRPAHLDLGKERPEAFQPPAKLSFLTDIPSPRAGEVPPALSPLDAFAMHSRMLARKFDEESQGGRRVSRLPHNVVAKEISSRPDFFRGINKANNASDVPDIEEEPSPSTQHEFTFEEQAGSNRPVSHYPRLSNAGGTVDSMPPFPSARFDGTSASLPTAQPVEAQGYFDMPRASSPESVDPKVISVAAPSPSVPSLTNSVDTVASHPRTLTNDSQRSQRSQLSIRSQVSDRGLAPPQSPRYPRSPRSFQSIRSVPPDSGDEDAQSINGSHTVSAAQRKFSGSSGMSRPQSPFSPWAQEFQRSPSMTSEFSLNSSQPLPRPAPNFWNFSRPMSSGGHRPSTDTRDMRPSFDSRPSLDTRPSVDLLHRNLSGASRSTQQSFQHLPSRQSSADDARTPNAQREDAISIENVSPSRTADATEHDSSTYVYAKYPLPRGRTVERNSAESRDSWIQRQFKWDEPTQAQSSTNSTSEVGRSVEQFARALSPVDARNDRTGRELTISSSSARSRSADPRSLDKTNPAFHRSTPSVATESTDRTIKGTPLHQRAASADLTAEEHLEIGIQAHSSGEVTKSTYHLRLAAISGLPTGMLLYALACRHGWGMRANQEEGVRWLRKAVETSGLDVADAEDKLNSASRIAKNDPIAEALERKNRKAQYALAIYELGISSMNGWGCAKNKPLALRCYEIAGTWGDIDALAEAGYCYTQGIGCKKDLYKAAALYRKAAASGMSMAGNSWIYKPKYMDDSAGVVGASNHKDKEKDRKRPDTAVSPESRKDQEKGDAHKDGKDKDSKSITSSRPRAKSLWGKKKERPTISPSSSATGAMGTNPASPHLPDARFH